MRIETIDATPAQEPLLASLLDLYANDFEDYLSIERDSSGRFIYEKLPLYWIDPWRKPFLVLADGEVVGFVLVKRGSELSSRQDCWDVAEFFVHHDQRMLGIGSEAARLIWSGLPGCWEVRVMQANQPAFCFWRKTIAKAAAGPVGFSVVEKGGQTWHLFSFEVTQAHG